MLVKLGSRAQLAEVMAASNLDPATLAQLNTVSALLPDASTSMFNTL